LNRYGVAKNAEKKFLSMLCSCIYYKDKSSRIRIFGRFLKIYDELNS